MFHPGETVMHTFVIPFNHNEINKVIITYKQNDYIILERELTSGFDEYADPETGQFDPTRTKITVELSQEESLMFRDKTEFYIQINVMTGHSRHASCQIKGSTGIQQYKEVISNGGN